MKGRYISVWECQFDKAMKENEELKDFATHFKAAPPPLRIREALSGGRTEPIYTLYDCQPGEQIRYLDYCVSV